MKKVIKMGFLIFFLFAFVSQPKKKNFVITIKNDTEVAWNFCENGKHTIGQTIEKGVTKMFIYPDSIQFSNYDWNKCGKNVLLANKSTDKQTFKVSDFVK
ncbi:MAG: hypothetical protein ACK5B9_11840 [Flavobacteriia bacterium]|jgi:hypothetical protein